MTDCYPVHYLNVTRELANYAVPGMVEKDQPFIVLTVRLDPTENFHFSHLGLSEEQALRLLQELQETLLPVLPAEQAQEMIADLQVATGGNDGRVE